VRSSIVSEIFIVVEFKKKKMSYREPLYTVPLKPIRNLLNPKFDGYKLKVFDEKSRLLHFQLTPPGITISKIPTNSKLSYKEIQSRTHFNHLFKGFEINKGKGICFYFDSDNFVILAEYDPVLDIVSLLFIILM